VSPEQDGTSYNDITPRLGVAYDVFGNGKTSVKVSVGKYLAAADGSSITGALTNPLSRISTSVSRTWTDANRNFKPDCDLSNPLAQDRRPSGGDFCGQINNLNFAKPVFSNTYDPAILNGWGIRPFDWNVGIQVQQQVLPRVSVNVGYFRRWFGNFFATDNLSVKATDYSSFSVTAPADSRLPGGGANVISGLYDVAPTLFGQTNNYVTYSDKYGEQYARFHGLDINVNARTTNGIMIQAGVSTGRTSTNNCEVIAQVPESLFGATSFLVANAASWLSSEWCDIEQPFLTQVRGAGAYTVPKIDVQVSATLQSKPGTQLAANFNVPSALAALTLGRPLSGNAANTTVNVVQPGELYGDRINQLDIRVAKILRFGRTRTQVGVDVYNVTNSSAIQTYNQTYGTRYLTPTLVLPARFAKVSAQFDF